jgi:hypothetical protein
MHTLEVPELIGAEIRVPVSGMPSLAEVMVLLCHVELRSRLFRLISLFKVRETEHHGHDHGLQHPVQHGEEIHRNVFAGQDRGESRVEKRRQQRMDERQADCQRDRTVANEGEQVR